MGTSAYHYFGGAPVGGGGMVLLTSSWGLCRGGNDLLHALGRLSRSTSLLLTCLWRTGGAPGPANLAGIPDSQAMLTLLDLQGLKPIS